MSRPAKRMAAGIRQQLPGELADQRGLAGAVRADDRVQFARRDIERQVVGRDDAAEPPHQIFNAKQAAQPRLSLPSNPMMPPRPNSTISSSSGPMISAQYSVNCDRNSSSTQIDDRADHRAEQRAHAAEDHHDHQIAGAGPVHHGRTDEIGVVGEQRAGKPADRAGNDEAGQPVARWRESRSPAYALRWSAGPAPPCRSAN